MFKFDTNYLWGTLDNASYTETGTYPKGSVSGYPSRPGFGTVTGTAVKGRRTLSVIGGFAKSESIEGETISLHYVPREAFDKGEWSHHTCG